MKKRNLLIQCPYGGGCDNYFVVEVKLGPTFKTKTYELKEIKGEDIPLYE